MRRHKRRHLARTRPIEPHPSLHPRDASTRSAYTDEFVEAARLFRESLALDVVPRVLRDYAQLLERMGRLRESADAWTRYAALAYSPQERDRAIAHREALRRQPSVLRVRVTPFLAAREARVWFDHDVPRPIPAGGAESLVEGGPHRVRVESRGYQPFETMVTTAFGETAEIVATLVAIPTR